VRLTINNIPPRQPMETHHAHRGSPHGFSLVLYGVHEAQKLI